jgi:acyl-CoA thioesterase FadM
MIAIRDRVRFVETDMMGVVHHANYLPLVISSATLLGLCGP